MIPQSLNFWNFSCFVTILTFLTLALDQLFPKWLHHQSFAGLKTLCITSNSSKEVRAGRIAFSSMQFSRRWSSSLHTEPSTSLQWCGLLARAAGSPWWPGKYLIMPQATAIHSLGTAALDHWFPTAVPWLQLTTASIKSISVTQALTTVYRGLHIELFLGSATTHASSTGFCTDTAWHENPWGLWLGSLHSPKWNSRSHSLGGRIWGEVDLTCWPEFGAHCPAIFAYRNNYTTSCNTNIKTSCKHRKVCLVLYLMTLGPRWVYSNKLLLRKITWIRKYIQYAAHRMPYKICVDFVCDSLKFCLLLLMDFSY